MAFSSSTAGRPKTLGAMATITSRLAKTFLCDSAPSGPRTRARPAGADPGRRIADRSVRVPYPIPACSMSATSCSGGKPASASSFRQTGSSSSTPVWRLVLLVSRAATGGPGRSRSPSRPPPG